MPIMRWPTHFELATHLEQAGHHRVGVGHFREPHRLVAYDGDWLTDVKAAGGENYYPEWRP
ncbi:MAG: hypothetical protein GY929_00835 [Actinomycetia bacterium]|nr:hypothetical protein [Actinomycetes bacterium]